MTITGHIHRHARLRNANGTAIVTRIDDGTDGLLPPQYVVEVQPPDAVPTFTRHDSWRTALATASAALTAPCRTW